MGDQVNPANDEGQPQNQSHETPWEFFISEEERHDNLNAKKADSEDSDSETNVEERFSFKRMLSAPNAADWIIAGFTIVIGVVGIFQWIAIRGQWKEMRASGKQTDQLICLYAKQVGKMAEQVEQTHALVQQADLDRRPWVGVQFLKCSNCMVDDGRTLVIGDLSVTLVNTGRTPAIDMVVEHSFRPGPVNGPIPDFATIDRERVAANKELEAYNPTMAADLRRAYRDRAREVLAPNAPRGITIATDYRQKRVSPPRPENGSVVYGFGRITYYDGNHTIQHTTTFCVKNTVGVDAEFSFCSTGNHMD